MSKQLHYLQHYSISSFSRGKGGTNTPRSFTSPFVLNVFLPVLLVHCPLRFLLSLSPHLPPSLSFLSKAQRRQQACCDSCHRLCLNKIFLGTFYFLFFYFLSFYPLCVSLLTLPFSFRSMSSHTGLLLFSRQSGTALKNFSDSCSCTNRNDA